MDPASCLSFNIECGVLLKGVGVVVMAAILFIGSVYLLLSAVFGRWMGYLVLMVAFSAWMIMLSALWAFGLYSQGPDTQNNLGPRGRGPEWAVLRASGEAGSDRYDAFRAYPNRPWYAPDPDNEDLTASVETASAAATDFLAEQANAELERAETDLDAITPTDFTVDEVRFTTAEDQTPLAVVEAHFTAGGPQVVLSMYHDRGDVARYSYMFLAGSILLFGAHLPLLDRAERKRKDFLTGGTAPAWYGPA
jgi:hypothetical protein